MIIRTLHDQKPATMEWMSVLPVTSTGHSFFQYSIDFDTDWEDKDAQVTCTDGDDVIVVMKVMMQ